MNNSIIQINPFISPMIILIHDLSSAKKPVIAVSWVDTERIKNSITKLNIITSYNQGLNIRMADFIKAEPGSGLDIVPL